MIFTIYCLGDVKLFASALNGVAMMYKVARGSSADMWTSNLPMGLGYGALLGALMALMIMIFTGYQKKQLDFRSVLLPLFLYFALTVPKATVVIQDAYSDQAPVNVDNVPIGLALPLGTISGIAMVATKQIETVFYVPYGGFTKITDEGYVAPLKLLHAIKYTGISANVGIPNLRPTLQEISNVCLVNNSSVDPKSYKLEINGFDSFLSALQSNQVSNRYVRVPVSGSVGEKVLSCADAGEYVSKALDAYMAGKNSGAVNKMLSDAELKKINFQKDVQNALNQQNNASESKGVKYSDQGKIVDAIGSMTGATNQEVVQFLKTAMLDGTLSTVNYCTVTKLKSDKDKCQNYISAVEKWKEGSAASASGFLAIMVEGQNLLIIFSIILFPIVLLVVIIKGVTSFKVFGSYILFTICSFMWLPIASIINFYTHLQLYEEFQRFNPTGDPKAFLSLKNAPAFYDAVSVKLTLANGALTSVPMISMGIFSGMLFTIQGLADKWNSQSKYFDAKSAIPDAIKRSPISNVNPSVNYASINGKAQVSGLAQAQTTSKSNNVSQALKQVEGTRQQSSKNLARMLSDTNVKDQSAEWKWSVAEKTANRLATKDFTSDDKKELTSALYSEMFGGDENVKNQYQNSLDTNKSKQIAGNRSSSITLGVKAGTAIGDSNDNDPDTIKDKQNGVQTSKAKKLLNEAKKRALISPDLGMGTSLNKQLIFSNDKSKVDGEGSNVSLSSRDETKSDLKSGNKNIYARGEQFNDAFSDVIASELNKAVTSGISNTKTNEASAGWQKKYEDYLTSANERGKASSYLVSQAKDSTESANMLNWDSNVLSQIKANIEASKMVGKPQFDSAVQGIMQKMNHAELGLMNEEKKLLLAQHTALKLLDGGDIEHAVNAVKAEYGHFNIQGLPKGFTVDSKIGGEVDAVLAKQKIDESVDAIQKMDFQVDLQGVKQKATERLETIGAKADQAVQTYTLAQTSIEKAEDEHVNRTKDYKLAEQIAIGDEILSIDSKLDRLPTQSELFNTNVVSGRDALFGKVQANFEGAGNDWDNGNYVGATGKVLLGSVQYAGAGVLNGFGMITPEENGSTVKHADGRQYDVTAVESRLMMIEEQKKFDEQIQKRNEHIQNRADKMIEKSKGIPD